MTFWKTTTIYGIGFIALRAISFLLLPLYTNLLSSQEAGWIFIIYTLLAFLNVLYTHGMNAALLKFFHSSNQKEIITTSIIYSTVSSLLLSIILFVLYFFYTKLTGIENHIMVLYILCIAVLDMLSAKSNILLRLLQRPLYYLSICCVNVVLSMGFNVYFIKTCNMGIMGAVNALFIVSIIQFLFLSPIFLSFIQINMFNYRLLIKMLSVGIRFFPAAIFFVLIEMSDRWMLGYFTNLNEVGLYGAGYKVGSVVLLVVNSFNLNWQPFYLKSNPKNRIPIFEQIGNCFILIMVFCTTLLSSLWPVFFQLNIGPYSLIGPSFWEGGKIIPIICISYVFYGLFILQMPSIFLKTKENWAPIIWGTGLLINILTNIILIPKWGLFGAAYATLFAYVSMSAIIIFKNQKWMPLKYNIKKLLGFVLFSIIVYWLSHAAILYNNILYILSIIAVYIGISILYIMHNYQQLQIKE